MAATPVTAALCVLVLGALPGAAGALPGASGTAQAATRAAPARPAVAANRSQTTASRAAPSPATLQATEVLHETGNRGGVIFERGSVTGRPFGSGRIEVRAAASGAYVLARFRVSTRGGTVSGLARLRFRVRGRQISYSGSARLLSGTGVYQRVSSGVLKVSGAGDTGLSHTVLHVSGPVSGGAVSATVTRLPHRCHRHVTLGS